MTAQEPGPVPEAQDHDANFEKRVAARTEELSTLSTHLIRMIESERSQLAKELHDELGGLITAAKMDMAWLQAHIGTALDPAGEEKFRSVVQMLNQAMTLKRRVVESLRPSLLDHFGLPVALRSHFEENCRPVGIEYVASLPEEIVDLEPAVQLTLFRVAQEALTNVLARGSRKTRRAGDRIAGRSLPDDGGRRRAGDGRCAARRARRDAAPAHGRRWKPGYRGGCRPGQPDYGLRPAIPSKIGMS